jgi:hypothetical protein
LVVNGLAGAFLCAAVAGCSYECHCPSDGCFNCSTGETTISVPADASSAASVVSASADSPCTATYNASRSWIDVQRPGAGSCTVHVVLENDATELAQVRFTQVSGPCGCYLAAETSSLTPIESGP